MGRRWRATDTTSGNSARTRRATRDDDDDDGYDDEDAYDGPAPYGADEEYGGGDAEYWRLDGASFGGGGDDVDERDRPRRLGERCVPQGAEAGLRRRPRRRPAAAVAEVAASRR